MDLAVLITNSNKTINAIVPTSKTFSLTHKNLPVNIYSRNLSRLYKPLNHFILCLKWFFIDLYLKRKCRYSDKLPLAAILQIQKLTIGKTYMEKSSRKSMKK
jgi:hypothetical protein